MATTVEQVETLLAREVGALKEDIAALRGDVQTLTAELRLDRESRARTDAAHDLLHADYERRLREQAEQIAELKARPAVTPKGMWAAVVSAVTVAGVIVGIVYTILTATK